MNRHNRQSKVDNIAPSRRLNLLGFPTLLAVILAILFAKSFLHGYVHFSNDGPLGQINAANGRMPGTLTGTWFDLNDIGDNNGASTLSITPLLSWILGPIDYSKFYQPLALFILGIGAWICFRQFKLSPLAATLGALATALNSAYVGNACWGTASVQIAMGMVFLALGLVMANSNETPPLIRWSRLALAGMAIGFNVMEGVDNGAIYSLFFAAFVLYQALTREITWTKTENTIVWVLFNVGMLAAVIAVLIFHLQLKILAGIVLGTILWNAFMAIPHIPLRRLAHAIARVGLIGTFAMFIAAQTVTAVIGAFVVGSAGMDQTKSAANSLEHWDWATQWSLPKKETIGIFVPGIFGYRMDTPKDMAAFLQKAYTGGQYWGGMGRTPEIDRFFDSGQTGSPPSGPADWMRFGYAGYYCGILVALVAVLAIAQSFRRKQTVFSPFQCRLIWFWTAVMIIALLLAWGRFAPFYHLVYVLPYFSSIRNPAKFAAVFDLGMLIIFAFGMDALSRHYMQAPADKAKGWLKQFKAWWKEATSFDRYWTFGSLAAFALCALGWLIYWSHRPALVRYLEKVGFPDPSDARQIASFSVSQVGWFLLFLGAAIALVILVVAGVFSGKRAWLGSLLLGALLVVDLGRSDLPWIIHWNYLQKYEVVPGNLTKSTNPIINLLADKPYEHRVADVPSESPFESLYRIEWMQHQFPFYNVQCLDIIQSPRVASDLAAYEMAMAPSSSSTIYRLARRWQLSNTKYLLGPSAYLDSLNQELDPVQRRFHILERFNLAPKPGIEIPQWPDQETAIPDTNGDYAVFEFSGALPRAKLYSDWQVITNSEETLQTLAAPDFDPQKSVLVSAPLPDPPMTGSPKDAGTVNFKSYSPKDFVLDAQAKTPSVLLVNDKFDPNWHVTIDGKPAELFRANFIMRGVFVPPGAHTVEFQFSLPNKPLYITTSAVCVGIVLCGVLFFATRPRAAR